MPCSAGVVDVDQPLLENFEIVDRAEPPQELNTKHQKAKKISTTFALINILKGMVGLECFSLPLAFKQAGLWTAFGVDFLLGTISAICMMKLVKSAQFLCDRNKCGPLGYGQLGQEAFASHKTLAKYKFVARWFINTCLILLQCGICSVYYIFVVKHSEEVKSLNFNSKTI
ncbi:unnamed protein product [Strongylus vulgaris]|uniref:Amino acid transporter transmembrane domain-containing protein n=1 Tax=Strongylus vulgaris TaxID=40348 RepID=A0A3P7IEN5_STRVU|nr:unnamed protein product [Strongylus vulgaris]